MPPSRAWYAPSLLLRPPCTVLATRILRSSPVQVRINPAGVGYDVHFSTTTTTTTVVAVARRRCCSTRSSRRSWDSRCVLRCDGGGRRSEGKLTTREVDGQVTVELKNDLALVGRLHSIDQFLNLKLDDVHVADEQKHPHMVRVGARRTKPYANVAVASTSADVRTCACACAGFGEELLHPRIRGAIRAASVRRRGRGRAARRHEARIERKVTKDEN